MLLLCYFQFPYCMALLQDLSKEEKYLILNQVWATVGITPWLKKMIVVIETLVVNNVILGAWTAYKNMVCRQQWTIYKWWWCKNSMDKFKESMALGEIRILWRFARLKFWRWSWGISDYMNYEAFIWAGFMNWFDIGCVSHFILENHCFMISAYLMASQDVKLKFSVLLVSDLSMQVRGFYIRGF